MGIWKQVGQQLGGLAKHVAKTVVQEPVEVIENAVGAGDPSASSGLAGNENKAMEAMEQGLQGQALQGQQDDTGQPKGFKTVQDYQKYQQLSGNRDEMELNILRKRLHQEHGLNTNLESGMQKARMEYEQKEEERKKVVEQKKQEEKWVIEQKKQEDMQVKAATESANAENKAWGAG